ncbi:MAG: DUF6702 family protein [Bacteroidia bacterium]
MKKIFLLLFSLCALSLSAHEYYIAIFEVGLSKDERSIQISAKFIAHDLEEAIMSTNGPHLNLGSKNEHPQADSLLFDYILRNFSINVNKKKISPIFVGKDVEFDEDLWVYIEIPLDEKMKEMSITNTCLISDFPSHQNIMHVTIKGQLKTYVFTKNIIDQHIQL